MLGIQTYTNCVRTGQRISTQVDTVIYIDTAVHEGDTSRVHTFVFGDGEYILAAQCEALVLQPSEISC